MERASTNVRYGLPLLVLLTTVAFAWQPKRYKETPVRRIDHIMIRTGDPNGLYAFLTEFLRLPVAWPLASRSGVTSGGVGFGNVTVEAITFPNQASPKARLVGFGFEPAPLASALAELRLKGVRYNAPRPFYATREDGSRQLLWTNVTLTDFSDADRPTNASVHIFLSEYSPDYVNVVERAERLRRELTSGDGGLLGVRSVEEVVIGTTDLSAATKVWERFLGPAATATSPLWQVGDGPAIRLVASNENALQRLVVRVSSLQRARAILHERNMLRADARGIAIEVPVLDGVRLDLIGDW
jgi:hypothetical protein